MDIYSVVWHDLGVLLLGDENYGFTKSERHRHPLLTYRGKTFLVFGQYRENEQGIYFLVWINEKLVGEMVYQEGKIDFIYDDSKEKKSFNGELLNDLRDRYYYKGH